MDFTLKKYEELCSTISNSNYENLTVEEYLKDGHGKFIILRHDVDKKPKSALRMAQIERKYGIKSTFYFRIKTFDKEIMREIKKMGHEIGYHYESLDEAKGNYELAIKLFKKNIEKFSEFNTKTICMHGNPLSKWINRDLWKKYDFKNYGILGEAYISIDFSDLEYFSDTGRTWHPSKYNIKDFPDAYDSKFIISSTDELINLIRDGRTNFYILIHPDKWNNNIFSWSSVLIFQSLKNVAKYMIKKRNQWRSK